MGELTMDLYLKHQRMRYQRGNRAQKKKILDQFCEDHHYHRKSATRLLNQLAIPDKARRKPGKTKGYKPEILLEPLKQLWLSSDQMCGKRLKQAIPIWIVHYGKHFDELFQGVYEQLLMISAQTPYQRLMASTCLSEEQKKVLTDKFNALDPFLLQKKCAKEAKIGI